MTPCRRWATAYARLHGARLPSSEQLAAIDALSAEEVNLADELRGAITGRDVASLVQLLAALGIFWTIRGEHARLIVLTEGVADAVRDWQPPPDQEDVTRAAMTILMSNSMIAGERADRPDPSDAAAAGPGSGGDPRLAGSIKVLIAYDPADLGSFLPRIEELAGDPDRDTALPASQWLSHARENVGDLAGAVEAASRALALATDDDGPWQSAILRTQLAQLDDAPWSTARTPATTPAPR